MKILLAVIASLAIVVGACTQEQQNRISRGVQNVTGIDGVLDVMSEGKIMYRFIKVDKLTTATATGDSSESRPYRFSYGFLDLNQDYKVDPGEKKVYFEVSDYSTAYLFYENPLKAAK